MNLVNQLQELAHSLPNACESTHAQEGFTSVLREAIATGDSRMIKDFLSNGHLNADMTRVTNY